MASEEASPVVGATRPFLIHLATGNRHKIEEFRRLAQDSGIPIEFAGAMMPAVVEDAGTFHGNARKKAAALQAKLPAEAWVLADDSGVCVEALDGAPGVESAYFAGPAGDSAANLRKLVEAMRKVPDGRRSARFVCVLMLRGPGGCEMMFEGQCDGALRREPAGAAGFGYDPLFIPDGFTCTYAELGDFEKNRISHRGRAWRKLADWWRAAAAGPAHA